MDDYLAGLADDIGSTWSTGSARRTVVAAVDPIRLSTDKAVALGMIANEWVSNACKYAYGDAENGEIRLYLRQTGDREIELSVEDEGPGMPANGAVKGTGLGTKLIDALARTNKADVRYGAVSDAGARPGMRASITLKLQAKDVRLSSEE